MADITARFRLDVSGVDAALARVAAGTLAVQGAFAAANAAIAPLAGAFNAVKASLDLGGQLSDVSAQTGIAVGDLVVLRQAFQNAGVGADAVGPAINRLQKALAGINEDGEPTNEHLAALGISMGRLQSLSPGEQFEAVAAALASIPDPTQRAATAMGIFGRKGGEMMALFRDASAMEVARQQVGGLASTMQANAGSFDAISDSFGSVQVKGQQLAAGLTAAIAPALAEIAESLNATDLTGLGEMLGVVAAAAVNLGAILSQMVPQIMGVTVAMALLRSGFDAKVITMFSSLGPKAIAAFAQVRASMASVSWSGFAAAGRAALTSIATAARAAGVAIKGALISTGIGILVAALASGIEFIMGKLDQAKEAVRRIEEASNDSARTVRGLQEEFKGISSEADKIAFGDNIDREVERVKAKLAEVNSDDNLSADQREDIAVHYRIEIGLLEKMKASMQNITPEIMAQRQAEKDRADALEESRRAAAGLNKELGKKKEGLDEKIKQDGFSEMSSTQQRESVLQDVGSTTTDAVDEELALLAAKRESSFLTDQEITRMDALIDARSKLVDIERDIKREREEQARKAEEEARKRAEFMEDNARSVAASNAQADGDTATVEAIQRETKIDQETERGRSAGLGEYEARQAAIKKVMAEERAANAEKARQNAEAQTALNLELEIARAKAAGNEEESDRLEWIKKYNDELDRAKSAGMSDAQAQEFAAKSANTDSEEKQRQQSENRKAFEDELAIAEAKKAGNTEEVKRLEWMQKYNAALDRAKAAGMNEQQAQDNARRMANAQTDSETVGGTPERATAGPLFASSMARIGAGGNFVGGSDGLLTETRRQTSLLQKIANSVARPTNVAQNSFVLN
ncbi:MAG: hypothetical protein KGR46_03295 [Verrucomicrobia bacterium]|nr:hypothetical protein [Verrucomicrobiota bacterium]